MPPAEPPVPGAGFAGCREQHGSNLHPSLAPTPLDTLVTANGSQHLLPISNLDRSRLQSENKWLSASPGGGSVARGRVDVAQRETEARSLAPGSRISALAEPEVSPVSPSSHLWQGPDPGQRGWEAQGCRGHPKHHPHLLPHGSAGLCPPMLWAARRFPDMLRSLFSGNREA